MKVWLPWVKRADFPGRGQWITIGRTYKLWDPVILVRDFIQRKKLHPNDFVWRWNDGRLLMRAAAIRAYQAAQWLAGEPEPWRTTGHSCRKGGAAAAKKAGLSKEQIKMLRRSATF